MVRALKKEEVPVVWWLHEPGSVGEHYLREESKLRAAMPLADLLLAPSEQTAGVYRPYTESPVKCLRNAIPDVSAAGKAGEERTRPLRFLLLASVEPRKGQDIFVKALAQLPKEIQQAAHFEIAGRILDPDFWPTVGPIAEGDQKSVGHRRAESRGSDREVERGGCGRVAVARRGDADRDDSRSDESGKAIITTTVGGASKCSPRAGTRCSSGRKRRMRWRRRFAA